jgi:hypothetical protein
MDALAQSFINNEVINLLNIHITKLEQDIDNLKSLLDMQTAAILKHTKPTHDIPAYEASSWYSSINSHNTLI